VAVVLGPVGRNFAAGMTGGVAYVWDPDAVFNRFVADTSPAIRRLLEVEEIEVRALIEEHHRRTASPVAAGLLGDWPRHAGRFWVLKAGRAIEVVEPMPDRQEAGAR
jgi:glutamate synthase (NADPH) large chain